MKCMSRVIKFRAWTGEQMLYPPDGFMFEATVLATNYPGGIGLNMMGRKCMQLMQFAGFKDKNDKDIYDGDIFGNEALRCIVYQQEDGRWMLKFVDKRIKDIPITDHKIAKSAIAGNIYENPELIPQLQTAR